MQAIAHTTAVEVTDPAMKARLLYSNPVCLLTAGTLSAYSPRNVMVVSWLTPIDNGGCLLMSINARRYTSELLSAGSLFVLNVPAGGMEPLVLAIGKCSGRDVDKFSTLSISTCAPGWAPTTINGSSAGWQDLVAIPSTVAHLVCEVTTMQLIGATNEAETSGGCKKKHKNEHYIIYAVMKRAYVQREYWDGKCFAALSADVPPTLTFLGSGKFGHICRQDFEIHS